MLNCQPVFVAVGAEIQTRTFVPEATWPPARTVLPGGQLSVTGLFSPLALMTVETF
jgi:hypothetical protein